MNPDVEKLAKQALHLVGTETPRLSFLGGMPRSASAFEWPRKNGLPLGFIAQLDLGEINVDQAIEWLPSKGRLHFFYDLDDWPWGFDPKDKGGWAVIFDDADGPVSDIAPPSDLGEDHRLPTRKYVTATRIDTYPDTQRIDAEELALDRDEHYDDYYEFKTGVYGDRPHHQMNGFPDPVQDDSMEEQSHLASNSVNCGSPDGYTTQHAIKVRNQPHDWRLLFQFDSDDDIEAMWGDAGMLYFWVKPEDAVRGKFDETWLVLQCS